MLDGEKLKAIADIPSRESVLSQLLGTILEPASRIARVVQAKYNPDGDSTPSSEPAAASAEAPAATPTEEPAAAE